MAEAQQHPKYPPLDGKGNNAANENWGAANTPFVRYQVPKSAYSTAADGLVGANRPSPREITLALTNTPYWKRSSRYKTSYLLTAVGQLVANDIARGISDTRSNGGKAPIEIPLYDPAYTQFGKDQMPQMRAAGSRDALDYTRSGFVRSPPDGSREQVNEVTHWVDGSIIYGVNATSLQRLRARTAGRMLLDDKDKLLPLNQNDNGQRRLEMKNPSGRLPQTQLRAAASATANQNPLMHSLITLFVREHNRRAKLIESANSNLGDEEVFQQARKWVIAHLQALAFGEYLNGLGINLPEYKGYNASINPNVDNFFSSAAYRYGHSTINDVVLRLDENFQEHEHGHLTLLQSWYAPDQFLSAGLDPIFRGLIAMPQAEVEPRFATSVAGNMFGYSTVNGTDLPAINIQRGRDHGVPDYNSCRKLMGLQPKKSFDNITNDADVARILQQLYKSVDNIDAYIGGLAEPHYNNAHVGELFYKSIVDQFQRLRDGDFYYFENNKANGLFTDAEVDEIRNTKLRELIMRNTNITKLPQDIWVAQGIPSASSGGASSSKDGALDEQVLGNARLKVRQDPQNPDWAEVTLESPTTGWLGVGVAKSRDAPYMIGADMVVGRMADGKAEVGRFTAPAHGPIVPAQGGNSGRSLLAEDDRLKIVTFEQSNGKTTLVFRRPTTAGGSEGLAMPKDAPVTLIVARGSDNLLTSYHGNRDREALMLSKGWSGPGSKSRGASTRRTHGTLMAINFILIMPLGALMARQLRSHWIKNNAVKAVLFYMHIATQLTGVIIATAGAVVAFKTFGVKTKQVLFGHGQIGIAMLVLIYSQLLVGFARPPGHRGGVYRHIWDIVHTVLGHLTIILGILNVILGAFIYITNYSGNLGAWFGLCGGGLAAIQIIKHILDRQEKYAVLRMEREHAAAKGIPTGNSSDGLDDIPDDFPDGADDPDYPNQNGMDASGGHPGSKPDHGYHMNPPLHHPIPEGNGAVYMPHDGQSDYRQPGDQQLQHVNFTSDRAAAAEAVAAGHAMPQDWQGVQGAEPQAHCQQANGAAPVDSSRAPQR